MRHTDRIVPSGFWMAAIFLGFLAQYAEPAEPESPRFSFGIVTDVQFADRATAGKRHYRESLGLLEKCVQDLSRRNLSFTIQLGDIINGNTTPESTRTDLDRILEVFQPIAGRLYHVLGNHCLTAGREHLLEKCRLSQSYYDFSPRAAEGWRMIVLDGNDAGYGVISPQQLDWLRQTLDKAQGRGERVLLFCHYAVAREAAAHHRLNQPQAIEEILARSPCVVAYLAGHDHDGGYAERNGLHHVTLPGMVEAPPQNAYAVVHVYEDRLELEGIGSVPSRKLALHQASCIYGGN